MPLISNDLLRNRVHTTIPMQTPYRETENQKRENIASFHALSREGLENGTTERRILLYETRCHTLPIWILRKFGTSSISLVVIIVQTLMFSQRFF